MRLRLSVFLLLLSMLGVTARLPGQITEHPSTIEPGRFLLEMDALSLTLDREGGGKYTAFGAGSAFLSTGLAHNWDIQVGAELFISQKYESGSFTERDSGIGDVYVRTKYRFFENTETGTMAAILPYVKIPTNSGGVGNDAVEGGIIVPWSTTLPSGFHCDLMAELDFLRNDADDGYDTYWYASASLSRQITKAIGVYGEATLGKSSGGASAEGLMGGGATLHVSEEIWWDYAMYRGISDNAADWTHVLRFNWGF